MAAAGSAGALAAPALLRHAHAADKKKNVLFIAVDDLKPLLSPGETELDTGGIKLTRAFRVKGCKICQVPSVWTDRTEGTSKFRMFKLMREYIRWLLEA